MIVNAMYPDVKIEDLTPAQFYREYKNGRSDVTNSSFATSSNEDGTPSHRVKGERKTKLTYDQVRYLRQNHSELSKDERAELAKFFGISKAFLYKVSTKRTMKTVSDEGNVWAPTPDNEKDM